MKVIRLKWLLVIFILIGGLTWATTMVKSGWVYSYGMGFWGANGHDGIWHLALVNSLAKELPAGLWQGFTMPVFAGEALKNYHIGFDILLAVAVRLTGISENLLYFQIIPPILASLIGILTYKFVLLWKNSKPAAFWATFFIYFGGSFGWLVSLIRGQGLAGESMFWSQQSVSTLINPPYALSIVIILCGIIFLQKYFLTHNSLFIILTSVVFGLLIEIKVYAGILVLAGLFAAGVFRLIKEKKPDLILLFFSSFVLSFLLYFPNLKNSFGLLVFQPFWYLETMMGLSDRLNWPRFYSAMTTYRMGGMWFKAIFAYFVAFIIFIAGNLGTRIVVIACLPARLIKLLYCYVVKKEIRRPQGGVAPAAHLGGESVGYIGVFLSVIVLGGILTPMFFLQKGTPWNTIQFFYYSLFFLGILAGVSLGNFIMSVKSYTTMIYIIVVVIVFFTGPTTVGTLKDVYLPSRPPAKLSNYELEALKFLSAQADGVVLTYPYDKYQAKEAEANPPRPLYLYESTAYVSAFSGKSVYLEDEVNLDITGYIWPGRRQKVLDFLNTLDQAQARKFLKDNNISYIYWVKPQRAKLGEGQLDLIKIYENGTVNIFEVTY